MIHRENELDKLNKALRSSLPSENAYKYREYSKRIQSFRVCVPQEYYIKYLRPIVELTGQVIKTKTGEGKGRLIYYPLNMANLFASGLKINNRTVVNISRSKEKEGDCLVVPENGVKEYLLYLKIEALDALNGLRRLGVNSKSENETCEEILKLINNAPKTFKICEMHKYGRSLRELSNYCNGKILKLKMINLANMYEAVSGVTKVGMKTYLLLGRGDNISNFKTGTIRFKGKDVKAVYSIRFKAVSDELHDDIISICKKVLG